MRSVGRKVYSEEFRESSVKLALESSGPISRVADDLGIEKKKPDMN